MGSSLFHTLGIGSESLYANRQGVDTAGHNIANAQTEGYSRQRVEVSQRPPSDSRGVLLGNGVYVKGITRAHDKFLEKQLSIANQNSGMSKSMHEALSRIEAIYSLDREANVSDEMTNFFNALQDLAANPSEIPVRTSFREAAKDLASAFNTTDHELRVQQFDLNEQVDGLTKEISDLSRQIARLNVEIITLEAGRTGSANDLRDQQDKLVRELSEKVDVNYYRSDHGTMVVRGPGEALLVDGRYFSQLGTRTNPETGLYDVIAIDPENGSSKIITDKVEAGQLRAALNVRDKVIPELIHQNNTLAQNFADFINQEHRRGYGLGSFSESMGRNLFSIAGGLEDAAKNLRVDDAILESVDAISLAATPNAPGDNVIVNDMLKLKDKKIMANGLMTFNEFYSNSVGLLGLEVQRAENEMRSDDVVLGDLFKRREAIAGVSLDEEAVNLLRWQTAFAASSKVITTVDEMLETVLSIKR